jgi:hypothetical protein
MLLLFGRDYRKLISQLAAGGIYRLLATWILVAACATYGEVGKAVALGVIAVSIMVGSVVTANKLFLVEQSREHWKDRLTNQLFYGLFWERLKSVHRESLDIEELFREAREKALADIKSAEAASNEEFAFIDKTGWHWIGAVIHFFGRLSGDVIFYGSALWVGTTIHF